jgi:hypothetical protein
MPTYEYVEVKRVTGMDDAVKKKAEELVEIDPYEPRAMREGTLFFCFNDYWVLSHNDGTGFWFIESIDGSAIPQKLEGKFTSKQLAMEAIERHGDPEQQARGRKVIEAKRTKLAQDVANGTKDDTPIERKKLPVRAIKDSLRRKKAVEEAARDKPTFME